MKIYFYTWGWQILPQSRENEDLFLYLADLAISSLLVIEDAGVLHDAETR
jgi:hypothetical protein